MASVSHGLMQSVLYVDSTGGLTAARLLQLLQRRTEKEDEQVSVALEGQVDLRTCQGEANIERLQGRGRIRMSFAFFQYFDFGNVSPVKAAGMGNLMGETSAAMVLHTEGPQFEPWQLLQLKDLEQQGWEGSFKSCYMSV